jgi:hypothetical protein
VNASLKNILKSMLKDVKTVASKAKNTYVSSAKAIPKNTEDVIRGLLERKDIGKIIKNKPEWMPGKSILEAMKSQSTENAKAGAKDLLKNLGVTVGVPAGALTVGALSLKSKEEKSKDKEKKASLIDRLEKAADIFVNKGTQDGGWAPGVGTVAGAGLLGAGALAHPTTNKLIGSLGGQEFGKSVREAGNVIRAPFEEAAANTRKWQDKRNQRLTKKQQQQLAQLPATKAELNAAKRQNIMNEHKELAEMSGYHPSDFVKETKEGVKVNNTVVRKAKQQALRKDPGGQLRQASELKRQLKAMDQIDADKEIIKANTATRDALSKQIDDRKFWKSPTGRAIDWVEKSGPSQAVQKTVQTVAKPFVDAGSAISRAATGFKDSAIDSLNKTPILGRVARNPLIKVPADVIRGVGEIGSSAVKGVSNVTGVSSVLDKLKSFGKKFLNKKFASYGYESEIVFAKGFEDFIEKIAASEDRPNRAARAFLKNKKDIAESDRDIERARKERERKRKRKLFLENESSEAKVKRWEQEASKTLDQPSPIKRWLKEYEDSNNKPKPKPTPKAKPVSAEQKAKWEEIGKRNKREYERTQEERRKKTEQVLLKQKLRKSIKDRKEKNPLVETMRKNLGKKYRSAKKEIESRPEFKSLKKGVKDFANKARAAGSVIASTPEYKAVKKTVKDVAGAAKDGLTRAARAPYEAGKSVGERLKQEMSSKPSPKAVAPKSAPKAPAPKAEKKASTRNTLRNRYKA